MGIEIRSCGEGDLGLLRTIALRTYRDTFGPMNRPETMEAYLAEAMDEGRLLSELRNPQSFFYFVMDGGEVAGYLKLNIGGAQADGGDRDGDSLEIERVYVDGARKGRGLGRALVEFAAAQAGLWGKHRLRLGVWELNAAAMAFYAKLGFRRVGSHPFRMGDEIQTDYVMEKEL